MQPLDPSAQDLPNLKILGPDDQPRASRKATVTTLILRANTRHPQKITRSHAPQLYDIMDDATRPGLTRLYRSDLIWPVDPDLDWTTTKKGPRPWLILTKKSKFSKPTCPTRFFKYIPILGSVSSFETRKLHKRPISKKIDLHKSWPKVKIFKKDLSCLVFCVDSNFRIYFFIWESKSAQDLKITNLTHFSEVLAVSKTQALEIKVWDSSI